MKSPLASPRVRLAVSVTLSGVLAGCAGGSSLPASSVAQSAPQVAAQRASGQAATLGTWQRAQMSGALPGSGCFQSSYPSPAWTRVPCSTPPNIAFPRSSSRGVRTQSVGDNVGDGADYTADTGSTIISKAIGSFPVVKGVKSVDSGGENGSYTLQLNSYFFKSKACGKNSDCEAWEQFVFYNPPPNSGDGYLFIQDWLVATGNSPLQCPPGQGWNSYGGDCYKNSPGGVDVPYVDITKLAKLVETGKAALSGDSIYMAVGKDMYGMKNVQSDGVTDLAKHWTGAEFNVLGNGGGDEASFNTGSTIEVSLEVDDGVKTAPTCPSDSGTTGESNNLNFVAAPSNPSQKEYPSILFTMSNAQGGGNGSCDTLSGS